MKAQRLSLSQILVLYIAVLVADALVSPFGAVERFTAWETTWAVLFDTVLLCTMAFFLFSGVTSSKAGPLWYSAAGAALLFSAAGAFLDAEQFYRFCSDEPLPAAVTLVVLLLVAFYALSCGVRTLSRVTGILLWLLAGSVVLLVVANLGKMQVNNLQLETQDVGRILRACVVHFRFPAALLLIFLLPGKEKTLLPMSKTIGGLIGLAAVQIGCALLSELVLGAGEQQYSQGMYTLARLGGISVFSRLDALHLCVWLLAMLLKGTILLCAAAETLHACRPRLSDAARRLLLLVLLLLAFAATAAMRAQVQQAFVTILSALAACVLCVRGRKYE